MIRNARQEYVSIRIVSASYSYLNVSKRIIPQSTQSRKRLTDSEQKILEKGLKFTPTPERGNQQELKEDIFEFTRKLRLAEYFYGTEDPDISLVKNKSDFIPPRNRNAALDRYI